MNDESNELTCIVKLTPLSGVTLLAETKKDYLLGRTFKVVSSDWAGFTRGELITEQEIHRMNQMIKTHNADPATIEDFDTLLPITVEFEHQTVDEWMEAEADCSQHGNYHNPTTQQEVNQEIVLGFLRDDDLNAKLGLLKNKWES